ncbi:MAG: hypothetical protein ACK4TN_00960 [Brevinematales bacterium]
MSAMGALIEWAGRKTGSGVFASRAKDLFSPKKSFEELDNFFLAIGENTCCHGDLLCVFFSIYIIEKILLNLSEVVRNI